MQQLAIIKPPGHLLGSFLAYTGLLLVLLGPGSGWAQDCDVRVQRSADGRMTVIEATPTGRQEQQQQPNRVRILEIRDQFTGDTSYLTVTDNDQRPRETVRYDRGRGRRDQQPEDGYEAGERMEMYRYDDGIEYGRSGSGRLVYDREAAELYQVRTYDNGTYVLRDEVSDETAGLRVSPQYGFNSIVVQNSTVIVVVEEETCYIRTRYITERQTSNGQEQPARVHVILREEVRDNGQPRRHEQQQQLLPRNYNRRNNHGNNYNGRYGRRGDCTDGGSSYGGGYGGARGGGYGRYGGRYGGGYEGGGGGAGGYRG